MNSNQQYLVKRLIDSLPPILSDEEIVKVCAESASRSKGTGIYEYNGMSFDVPEHVHVPGATSRTIHDKLADNSIELNNKSYIVMGVGCGVEPVIAAMKKARVVYAVDIDEASTRATIENFAKLAGEDSSTELHTFVSDLLNGLPDNIGADVITFNPPTIHVPLSDDPDVLRTVCSGPDVMTRLFLETRAKGALANDGQIIITVSNSSDLRGIVTSGVEHGFVPSILARYSWPAPYDKIRTHVFCFGYAKD
jgi:release factor glutamine methyltransferase